MQELKKNFKFYAITYGCRVNQYETQSIREYWISLGGVETEEPAEADVIFIDSCAVTAEAVADALASCTTLTLFFIRRKTLLPLPADAKR